MTAVGMASLTKNSSVASPFTEQHFPTSIYRAFLFFELYRDFKPFTSLFSAFNSPIDDNLSNNIIIIEILHKMQVVIILIANELAKLTAADQKAILEIAGK